MTDATELPHPELEPLEPLLPTEGGVPPPAAPSVFGAPPPFFRSDAHSEYYRFLFAGLVMTLGCLMPFSGDLNNAGYKSLGGAFYLVLALALVWSMWIAVYSGRFRMKWILLSLIPFVIVLLDFIYVERDAGVRAFREAKMGPIAESWLEAVQGAVSRTEDGTAKAANFCRAFGTGRVVLFLGGLLNLMFLFSAVFGGARHAKGKKVAARAATPERRGR